MNLKHNKYKAAYVKFEKVLLDDLRFPDDNKSENPQRPKFGKDAPSLNLEGHPRLLNIADLYGATGATQRQDAGRAASAQAAQDAPRRKMEHVKSHPRLPTATSAISRMSSASLCDSVSSISSSEQSPKSGKSVGFDVEADAETESPSVLTEVPEQEAFEAAHEQSSAAQDQPSGLKNPRDDGNPRTAITQAQFLKVKAIFDDIDQEGEGKVTLKELLEYSVKNPIPVKVFMRMTLDTTGVVTLPELVRCYHPQVSLKEVRYAMEVFIPQLQAHWRERLSETSMSEIGEIFALFARRTGSVSLGDLAAVMEPNEHLAMNDLKAALGNTDADENYVLEQPEFENLLKDYYIQQQHSSTRHPTLEFLTAERRIQSVWPRMFPRMPNPENLLRPKDAAQSALPPLPGARKVLEGPVG
jgi:hypothetical protein